MKRIVVDPFTFEVARAVDRDLSERLGDEFSANSKQERLAAVLFALKDWSLIPYHEHGREIWFCFGLEVLAEQLHELEGDLTEEVLERTMSSNISLKLKESEILRSIELSKRYGADLDVEVAESSWTRVGAVVRLLIKGDLRLIGPEVEDGLVAEDLTRSAADKTCCVWCPLGNKLDKKLVMVDLEEPEFVQGQPLRIPIKAVGLASGYRRAFVNLMEFSKPSSRKSTTAFVQNRLAAREA